MNRWIHIDESPMTFYNRTKDLNHLRKLRTECSIDIVKSFDKLIDSLEGGYLQDNLIGKAINYYLSGKEKLHRFLSNELVPIDNNAAERSREVL